MWPHLRRSTRYLGCGYDFYWVNDNNNKNDELMISSSEESMSEYDEMMTLFSPTYVHLVTMTHL
jgi:hypothetical protein